MNYHKLWSFCSHLSRGMGFSIFHSLNLPFADISDTYGNSSSDCCTVTAYL